MTRPVALRHPSRPTRRGMFAGTAALLGAGLLAACSDEPTPPPAPPTGPAAGEPTPAVTQEQFGEFVTAVNEAVTSADEAHDAELLAPRVAGSAAAFRTDLYEMIAEVEGWSAELTVPSAELMLAMPSTSEEFPRQAIALVGDTAEDGVPFFMALQQADAHSPYATWGWARQQAGVEMPTVPSDVVGSEQITADTADLLMTPAEALALFAKVLSDGASGDPDGQLAESPYQTEVHGDIQNEREELNADVDERDEGATIKEVYSVVDDEILGVRTDDGGAIVMSTFTSTRTLALRNDATLRYEEANLYTEYLGRDEFTTELVRTYGTTVAVYVPPAGSDQKVQPIGATRMATGASGS